MIAPRLLATVTGLALVGACSPDTPENEIAAGNALDAAEGGSAEQESETTALNDEGLPNDFARTAWRVEDEDGARYTTFLDDGGRYRDLRNGDPWHSGSWEVDAENQLCLTPDTDDETGSEGAAETAQEPSEGPRSCWNPRGMDGDGGMIVQASSGKRVRLQQVDYRAPDAEDSTADSDTGSEASAPA